MPILEKTIFGPGLGVAQVVTNFKLPVETVPEQFEF
jgi:hypothetical protein